MKVTLFLLLFIALPLSGMAQDKDPHRERIKALKTAYITKGLELTSEEAEKFWPIYNEFERKRRQLFRKEHRDIGELHCISEDRAEEMLAEYIELERQDYLLKRKFFTDLKGIFSAHRIIELKKIEDDFNKKLIREYRERHSKSDS